MPVQKKLYTVGQVNSYIKDVFARDMMLAHLWIKGEVSGLKYHSSGHIYFSLKDNTGTISCVMFARDRNGLKFVLQEGMGIQVHGRISVYEKNGTYQVYADRMERDGIGALYEQYERLKKDLEEEGLFAAMYKKEIPVFANRIGIVTAPTGAAIQDIINISKRRNPYVQLILYPAVVQGEKAAESVVKGIERLDKENVDVIIVGRGGGSIEDLWAFNEEIVARAIFDCDTPIISAVGHEVDWTIADFVSDLRAPTPSAAAELAVVEIASVFDRLEDEKRLLHRNMRRILEGKKNLLFRYEMKIKKFAPVSRIEQKKQLLERMHEKLSHQMHSKLTEYQNKKALYEEKLLRYSPYEKMSKGFAYVETSERKPLKTIDEVKKEDDIMIYLQDGKIMARVTETMKKGEASVIQLPAEKSRRE